jgi:hypothetical protein
VLAELLERLHHMLVRNETRVDSILFENNNRSHAAGKPPPERLLELLVSYQSTLGYEIYVLDDHSHMLLGEQRVYDFYGRNVGAPATWAPPAGLREYAHVRFFSHLMRVDEGISVAGWRRIMPKFVPVNLLLTRVRLIEPSRGRQIHPHDFRSLEKRYRLPQEMLYHFPHCGRSPAGDKLVPCTGRDA